VSNIVIVGADQGIGYYLVQCLLKEGNRVCVMDIRTENIQGLSKTFPDSLLIIKADAADETSIYNGVQKAHSTFGSIDIAIHNACLCTFESEPDSDIDLYKKVMDINYFGALRLAKAVLPYMREEKKGRVIFTSSGVGVTGFGNISPYASSKGALESLAKCLNIENHPYGITFHLFHPPLTRTASSSGLPVPKEFMASAEKVGRGLAKNINKNRFIICHSLSQMLQMILCYRHPIYMGKMMWKMTTRAPIPTDSKHE